MQPAFLETSPFQGRAPQWHLGIEAWLASVLRMTAGFNVTLGARGKWLGGHPGKKAHTAHLGARGPVAKTKVHQTVPPLGHWAPGWRTASHEIPSARFHSRGSFLICPATRSSRGCLPTHLLRFVYEVISFVPVGEEVRGLLVIHSDVMVCKQAREEVVYFSSDI